MCFVTLSSQQRWLRVIPIALVMYTIAYIDRTNISMAMPSMSRDLRMDASQAGNVAGIFFWGYLLLQIPGGHLANRWSAKHFISILLVAWGVCATGCGLIRTWQELWVMRLLLGVAEGGVYSATLVLLSHWFPRKERARANALWLVCLPLALIISSPFSGWVLDHWNWRFMLVAEGGMPFLWLMIWKAFIHDHPREAGWISAAEREYVESTLEHEAAELELANTNSFLRVLVDREIILLILICFLRNIADSGFLMWLPSALQSGRKLTNTAVGELFTIPFMVAIITMLVNSWHSDKSGERRGHLSLTFALGGVFLLMAVLTSLKSSMVAFVFVCLAGIEYAPLGPFWAIPTETLPRGVAGPAMGLINAIGTFGGFFGPLAVGYLNKRVGGFLYGFSLLGVLLLLASVLCLMLKPKRSIVVASKLCSQGLRV